ncbi:DUF77 domain-containing protein [Campylobacter sp. RM16704]|uniref:DUF77 domain-containing protein n=1 Tax=Campylobacter sp. RM16704 TaxID=1500960 RepID=UPI0005804AAF|nr:DUF77 domain-containing protein [Campylobacter sp. RM16704]AJC86567.1 putative protein (DUF77 domain) [Campylobacter sp. RM16704]
MSVLMEFSIFSISGEISKKEEVVKILKKLQKKNIDFKLHSMGTCVECKNIKQALKILHLASKCMDTKRYYINAKFDCYKNRKNAIKDKIKTVKERL